MSNNFGLELPAMSFFHTYYNNLIQHYKLTFYAHLHIHVTYVKYFTSASSASYKFTPITDLRVESIIVRQF